MTLAEVKAMLEAWIGWESESGEPPPEQPLELLTALLAITDRLLHIDGDVCADPSGTDGYRSGS